MIESLRASLANARFCRSLGCDVVYFDAAGRTLRRNDVTVRVGVKETEDPITICYCFGFTRADVRSEVERSGASTIADPHRRRDEGRSVRLRTKESRWRLLSG